MLVTISFFNKSPTTGMVAWSFRSSHGITSVPGQPPRTGPVPAEDEWALHPARRLDEIKKEPRHSARLRIIKKRPVKRAQKGYDKIGDIRAT